MSYIGKGLFSNDVTLLMNAPMIRTRGWWARRLALAAGATLLSLAVAEVLIRALCLAPAVKAMEVSSVDCVYCRSTNPILGFELKPNYRHANPDYEDTYERTNTHGLRDRERSLQKPAGVHRVILLGDSIVEGHGLPEDETISQQLELLFPDQRTEVLNFGVSSYCTRSEVELLEVKGLKLDPDVVVLVFVENDFLNWNIEHRKMESSLQRPRWAEQLFVYSDLFRLNALSLNLFSYGSEFDPHRWNHRAIGNNNVVDGLKRFSELARLHHFVPAVIIWPRFLDDRIVDMHAMPDSEELVVERLARANGIPSFRLTPYFEEDLAQRRGANPRLLYTQGDMYHPSPDGSCVAASAVKKILAELSDYQGLQPLMSPEDVDRPAEIAATQLGTVKPNYAILLHNQGVELYEAGRIAETIEVLTQAAAEYSPRAKTHVLLGSIFAKEGDYEQSRLHFERAVAIDPLVPEAHFGLGYALAQQQQPIKAVDCYELALRADPEFAEAHFAIAQVRDKEHRLSEAITHFSCGLEVAPDRVTPRLRLALLLWQSGRDAEAVHQYRNVLERSPDNLAVCNDFAWLLATHQKQEYRDGAEAVRLAEKAAAESQHQAPAILDTLAGAYAETGRFDEALSTARQAIALAGAAGQRPLNKEIERHLRLYEKRLPFRTTFQMPHDK